ncbi:hypothetical protein [Romboutsia sp.]|uniref:hypothetical protein n=1 Tax=Romboutsia sp. TaxID=1965302 RepID=UPI003F2B6500
MKIAIINGSPKVKENNTQYFLEELKNFLKEEEFIEFNIRKGNLNVLDYEKIYNCDRLIIGFPLYVDSLPSHLLEELIKLQEFFNNKEKKNISVYTIANCGFFEGRQNHLAIAITKNWCKRVNLNWGQGIGIGAGEMFGSIKTVPLGRGPKKSLSGALDTFSQNIKIGKNEENIYVSPNFPRVAFKFCATMSWNAMAKNNGLKRKDLF